MSNTKEKEVELFRRVASSSSLMGGAFKRCSPKLREYMVFFVDQAGVVLEIYSDGGIPDSLSGEYRNLILGVTQSSQLSLGKRERHSVSKESFVKLIKISDEKALAFEAEKKSGILTKSSDPIHESRNWIKRYLEAAMKEGASDVHFCARKSSSSVLFRIHGILERHDSISYASMSGNLSALYSSSHDPRSNSEPGFNPMKDASCTMTFPELNCKLRWQTTARGQEDEYDVILRIIPYGVSDKPMTLVDIGFLPSQVVELRMMAGKPDGLIMFSGVTGSGKSTTLQAMMSIARGDGERKIYSLEDPIERVMYGITQIQIQRADVGADTSKKSSPFAAKIATLMRSDPDVIMVGEVRDTETANACIDGARTGHLIFSTLHAPNAMGIAGRLSSPAMGIETETLATPGILSCLVYQRLLPVLCPHCKIRITESPQHMDDETLQYHLFSDRRYSLNIDGVYVRGAGCSHCRQRKIVGQTVCAEIIRPSDDMLEAVLANNFVEAKKQWRRTRISTFVDENFVGKTAMEVALFKVNGGYVDPYSVEDGFGNFGLHDIVEM